MTFYRYPLLPLTAAYIAGLWLALEVVPVSWMLALSVFLLGLALALWTAWKHQNQSVLLLVLVVALGALRMSHLQADRRAGEQMAIELDNGGTYLVRGRVANVAWNEESSYSRFFLRDVVVTSGTLSTRLPGKLQVTVSGESGDKRSEQRQSARISPGDRVKLASRITPPQSFRNFLIYDHRERLAQDGVFATAHVGNWRLIQRSDEPVSLAGQAQNFLRTLRRNASAILLRAMPRHEADLMVSMLFNDMKRLSEADRRIFRDSGTMHLFAVSGLHVAIMAMILNLLFRTLRFSIRTSWVLVILVLSLYVLLLDFLAPASRSLLMVIAYASGHWLKREIDSLSRVLFGVAVIVFLDPMAAWQASFQLSALGVVAIVAFTPLMNQWIPRDIDVLSQSLLAKVRGWLIEGFQITLAVTVVLLPLQFYYFQQFHLLSPITNVIASALSAPVLSCAFLTLAVAPVSMVTGQLAGAATAGVMEWIWWVSSFTASLSDFLIHVPKPPKAAVFGYYVILFSGYYMVRRHTPEFSLKSLPRFISHAGAAVCLMMVTAAVQEVHRPLRVWFLDVGQGDSTLIEFPTGQSLLVDAGNIQPDLGRLVVEPQLRALGIRPLGQLLVTHADADHAGGALSVLANYPVKSYAENFGNSDDDALMSQIHKETSLREIPVRALAAGDSFQIDSETRIDVLAPSRNMPATAEDNERSVVLRLTHGNVHILLTGDAPDTVESELIASNVGRVHVLKAGHHGSGSSTSDAFLSHTQPQVAIISCGQKNRYGHPHPRVLKSLERSGSRVYRTDQDGAVLLESDGEKFSIQTARKQNY